VATTARVSVQAGADFALPTEEELEATPPPGGEPEPDEGEISPYAAADTYLVLSLALKDPLVPKPPTPAPKVPDVRDLIETHAPLDTAPRPRSAEARLRADCRKIVDALADDYRDLFMLEDGQAVQVESSEERRKQAVFHLNASGRYYDFKERIKRSVQLLVHERLMKLKETCYEDLELIVRKCPETHHPLTSGHVHGRFNTPACGKCAQIVEEEGLGLDELDPTSDHGKRFLSNLYASIQETLNAEMHALFNPKPEVRRGAYAGEELDKMLADELRLAVEAQINRNVALCESHLNKRVAASPHDAQLWYDFGRMALQNGSFEKAQDCLREALAIDPRHVPALLAYGVYLCRHDRFADAESYFLGATLCDPGDVTARAMLVLFYDMESRDLDRRAALKKVLDLEAGAGAPPRSAYLRAAALCVELKALALVERCQAQEVLKRGDSQELRLLVARALMADGKHEAARAQLQAALAEDRRCAGAMLLMGHSLFEEDGWARARCDIPRGGSGREPIQWFERGRAQSAPVPAHMREPHHELLSSLHLAKLYIATGRCLPARGPPPRPPAGPFPRRFQARAAARWPGPHPAPRRGERPRRARRAL
jgi:tetratricopeptide (TPR) repeat protein